MFINLQQPKRLILSLPSDSIGVTVVDCDLNKVYYQRDLKKGTREVQLNINKAGNFRIDNIINYKTVERKKYCCFIDKLPAPEKDIKKQSLYIAFNPTLKGTPARIDVKTGRIEIGNQFLNLPTQVQEFIIFHEIGHNYYFTETYCDQYALKQFINNYGNPSQALYSLVKVFKYPEYQAERIMNIYNNIIT